MKLKRLLLAGLSLTAMLCMALGFAACGEKDHEHSLKQTAAKEATCGAAGNSAYYTCDGCGKYFSDEKGENEIQKDSWVIAATGQHTPESGYEKDASGHWHECRICGTKLETEAHDGDPCTVCEYTASTGGGDKVDDKVDEGHVHNLVRHEAVPATCIPGNTAYYACEDKDGKEGCGKFFSDLQAKNEITEADWVLAAKDPHSTGDFVSDATGHWRVCSVCKAEVEKSAHDAVWAKNTTQHWGVCKYCGFETSEKVAHAKAEDTEYTKDKEGHSFTCECGQKVTEAHLKGVPTQLTAEDVTREGMTDEEIQEELERQRGHSHKYTCEVCNYEGQDSHKLPTGGTADESSGDGHKFTCECGQLVESDEHTGTYVLVGETSHQMVCSGCGYEMGEPEAHIYNKWYNDARYDDEYHWYACSKCGYEDLTTKEAHDDVKWSKYPDDGNLHSKFCSTCIRHFVTEPHAFTGNYHTDLTSHWDECTVCGTLGANESHTYDDNMKCTVCNNELKASVGLDIRDGILYGRGSCSDAIIVVPNDVTEIAENAFYTYNDAAPNNGGDSRLTGIYIPASVTRIAGGDDDNLTGAFTHCKKLTTVIIAGATTIEPDAFYYCSNLEYVEIGDGAVVKADAFRRANIQSVVLGKVETLENNCISSNFTFKGTLAEWKEIADKNAGWWSNTYNIKVTCTDGVADANGNITEQWT